MNFAVFCADFSNGESTDIHWCRTFENRESAFYFVNGLTNGKNYIRLKDDYIHSVIVSEKELDFDSKIPLLEQTYSGYSIELLESNPISKKS